MVKIQFEKTLQSLYQLRSSPDKKRDLTTVRLLSSLMGFPEKAFPSVHVAGSNGKGSVAFKIAKALEFSGYKVGLYLSPHLFSFTERISINGKEISFSAVHKGIKKIFRQTRQLPQAPNLTFFETVTLLAFDYFREKQVDVAVIEAGLGGRLDATNILSPLVTILTSISREHSAVLGESCEEIAREKAGIIKEKVPLIVGPFAHYSSIDTLARAHSAPLIKVETKEQFYDDENRSIAQASLEVLSTHFSLQPHAIEKSLVKRPPFRFEKRGNLLFDVAHNPDAFKRLFEALALFFPKQSYQLILGMSEDKEIESCLRFAANGSRHIHLVQAKEKRAAPVEALGEILTRLNFFHYSPFNRKKIAPQIEQGEDLFVVCGSFYIMKPVQEALLSDQPLGT